jgi:precorrin-6B C5,15-methyltransferase / cobalt-precorrin-6B C5,C15-methyltransferase
MQMDSDRWQPPQVALIGMGMGKDDLSALALRWIERAEVLIGGRRHLECFPEHTAERVLLRAPIGESIEKLRPLFEQKRSVVLASGDPFFFGIGRRLAGVIGGDRVLSLPNVTSVQALFSRLAEPWEDVKVISLHGRGDVSQERGWLRELRIHRRVAVFTDPHHTPSWIAEQMIAVGVEGRVLVVAEDLGLPSERIQRLSLEEAEGMSFSPLNIVAILPEDGKDWSLQPEPLFGAPESAFRHKAGLITKMEIRAVVLASLQLRPDLVLWDLGAASGSIAIEAARVASLKQVFAVEKNAERYLDLQENIRRFKGYEIRPLHGSAQDVIDRLPDPDRVFIGGSGGDLEEVLEQVASRLRPGGCVVQTAVTLETLQTARTFWSERSFESSIIQLQVSRSVPIGKTVRFQALNPVFVITVRRANEGIK